MSYKNFKAPFIKDDIIKLEAESFRTKFCGNIIPVDIETIIEKRLEISVVPVPELENISSSDALISSNWECIYVDHRCYSDDRYESRVRFSLAHEMGHFVLHKKIYNELGIKKLDDVYLMEELPEDEYSKFEHQATRFASHILIPREHLIAERKKLLENHKTEFNNKRIELDWDTLDGYLAIPLSKIYKVSESAMNVALSDIRVTALDSQFL
ncbi:MAG: ImmA/IrrE family metallo-endopeptidase [Patescibacteria group bacterium]|nr:ImmA/IrrE family metallo-endopeptidase [Patescibacteria group bacterium]